MEPMTLGSPTHSPSGSPNVSYLPPFLLGEINPPSLAGLSPRTNSLSPTKGRSVAFGNIFRFICTSLYYLIFTLSYNVTGSPTSPTQTSTPDQKLYKQSMSVHQQALYNQQNLFANMPTSPNMSYSMKTNGPPIEDLFDTIKSEPSMNISTYQENSFVGNNNSIMHNSYMNNVSTNNQLHIASPWQDGYQEQDDYWVTVFGFPPNAANTVLARFGSCGVILGMPLIIMMSFALS